MKCGYRLVIHKNVPSELTEECKRFLHSDIMSRPRGEEFKCRRTSGAFYRCGVLGLTIGLDDKGRMHATSDGDATLTFRRISKGRRIYAIIPIDCLERVDGEPIDLNNCMCAEHRGGQRVQIKGGFNEDDFETYCEVGEIRG